MDTQVQGSTAGGAGTRIPVVLIEGDGIGPEVAAATVRILDAAGAGIEWRPAVAGAQIFKAGNATGVPQETLDAVAACGLALKGPLETPVGYGEKSANVTLRKVFELYGNIRPVRELPGIQTPFSGRGIDFVIVRENVEDLYAGIEYMQTPGVAQCLKLISHKGSEKIARLAFALARAEGRRKVTCATKANIMKLTEGLFKRRFEAVAKEYPDIQSEHQIVDNCAHQMVIKPEQFDIVVMTNMNGDILSDLAAGLVGGLGVAPSSNIGREVAMFEAVHGSAPQIAGKGVANPTALLQAGIMMLRHIGKFDVAAKVEQALFAVLAEGRQVTGDIARGHPGVGTAQFVDAVLEKLGTVSGEEPGRRRQRLYAPAENVLGPVARERRVVGCDVWIESTATAEEIGRQVEGLVANTPLRLKMVSSRGTKVFPAVGFRADAVDQWCLRFMHRSDGGLDDAALFELMQRLSAAHIRWMNVEKLQRFDGADGFTLAAGED
ncbi:MAG TPA: NADP-dependent isocitrate dehydrogenase [Alphaproteobacteria bacterium]|nr:NADP-dependent isocitrate dehydrogenase [Alphaproteobacteria bacterium]